MTVLAAARRRVLIPLVLPLACALALGASSARGSAPPSALSAATLRPAAATLRPAAAAAVTTALSPHSWDPGLFATVSPDYSATHAWGTRQTAGAWGTGPVNYQSGATTSARVSGTGSVQFTMSATHCSAGSCSYGAGTGYKALVQIWNDPSDFIAFGLIHDPGVSPSGMTVMVEGAAHGTPVGGYWPAGAVTGSSHSIVANWGASGVTFTLDGTVKLGSYPLAIDGPSISFLGAGRETGDTVDVSFSSIVFRSASALPIPAGAPYLTYSDTITEGGSGSGYSAYLNAHDATNDALSVGIQSDTGDPASRGRPYFVWERVQGGVFSYAYLQPASNSPTTVTLKWWSTVNEAVFFVGSQPIASIPVTLHPRLFFNVEGNARLNGDTVNDSFGPVSISVGTTCPTYCGLNGAWNTGFSFYGLRAQNTNGRPQNGATFTVRGTVNGVPAGGNWDSYEIAGIAMIAQYWNGA